MLARQNRQNRHEGYPPETQPPLSVILRVGPLRTEPIIPLRPSS